jgi:hypothetical protein
MAATVGANDKQSDHGHTGAVDDALAREHGGKPATWHSRRFGPHAVNDLAAAIIRQWRLSGDLAELAEWVRPIEEAMAHESHPFPQSPMLRSAIADAAEDDAEARFRENPCEETARVLLRRSALERQASLDRDRELAAKFGIPL